MARRKRKRRQPRACDTCGRVFLTTASKPGTNSRTCSKPDGNQHTHTYTHIGTLQAPSPNPLLGHQAASSLTARASYAPTLRSTNGHTTAVLPFTRQMRDLKRIHQGLALQLDDDLTLRSTLDTVTWGRPSFSSVQARID